MRKIFLLLISFLMLTGVSFAATFSFDGTIDYHNDVVQFGFALDNDATDVRIWTDSYEGGTNFDPITALWTGAGNLIDENDDNSDVNPATQTIWDSGFTVASLSAGDYLFTVAAYDNFANGVNLSDGFSFDGETPIPIENWWEEAPGYYNVNFDGVDSVTPDNPVPEPTTMLLFGVGLLGIAGVSRKKERKI